VDVPHRFFREVLLNEHKGIDNKWQQYCQVIHEMETDSAAVNGQQHRHIICSDLKTLIGVYTRVWC